jgi:hypothetical protein
LHGAPHEKLQGEVVAGGREEGREGRWQMGERVSGCKKHAHTPRRGDTGGLGQFFQVVGTYTRFTSRASKYWLVSFQLSIRRSRMLVEGRGVCVCVGGGGSWGQRAWGGGAGKGGHHNNDQRQPKHGPPTQSTSHVTPTHQRHTLRPLQLAWWDKVTSGWCWRVRASHTRGVACLPVGSRTVRLAVVKGEPGAGQGVLHVVHDGALNGVNVCAHTSNGQGRTRGGG